MKIFNLEDILANPPKWLMNDPRTITRGQQVNVVDSKLAKNKDTSYLIISDK